MGVTRDGGDAGASARWAMWGVIAVLLLLPLVAMQFSEEMAWDGADFAAAALLLVGAGAIYEVVARNTRETKYRRLIAVMLIAGVVLLWAHGAVGVF